MPATLTMTRSGEFTANFVSHFENKCDRADNFTYPYSVTVTATDEHLSGEGFVMENSRVQSYFERTFAVAQPALSCERIALTAAKDLFAQLLSESISVVSVEARLTGSNGAGITAVVRI